MSDWSDPVEINLARELLQSGDPGASGNAFPFRQALLNLERKHGFKMRRLFERVRTGAPVWNKQFDQILPLRWRRLSVIHWTPVQVARRAAQLLVTQPETRVLDVGSGPGKFCFVGVLATQGHFTGVEQRQDLVEFSQSFARQFAIPRVQFWSADARDLDWSSYNAFYFYNPFYENLDPDKKIDERGELSSSLYNRYIRMAQERLAEAAPGTRVVTFHGMGGEMPDGYERVLREFHDTGFLELWIKNPCPEELQSFQNISRCTQDVQAPCLPAPNEAGAEDRLLVYGRTLPGTGKLGSEVSLRSSTFENPCPELPNLCSRS